MQVRLIVTLELSADEGHIISFEDHKDVRDAVLDAIEQRYQNGFDLAGCYVEGFSVIQDSHL